MKQNKANRLICVYFGSDLKRLPKSTRMCLNTYIKFQCSKKETLIDEIASFSKQDYENIMLIGSSDSDLSPI